MSFPVYKVWEVRIPNRLKFSNIEIQENNHFTYHVKAIFIDAESNEFIISQIDDDNGIAFGDLPVLSSLNIPNMVDEETKIEAIMNWFLTTEGYTTIRPQFLDFA